MTEFNPEPTFSSFDWIGEETLEYDEMEEAFLGDEMEEAFLGDEMDAPPSNCIANLYLIKLLVSFILIHSV